MHYIKAIVLFVYFFTHAGNVSEHTMKAISVDPVNQIIETVELNLDMPYDARNIKGYDCSGLVQFCYSTANISIPRSSNEQYLQGNKIERSDAKPGDIICFAGSNKNSERVGHVGIIVSIDEESIEFIHSSSSKGVITSSAEQNYYKERFRGIVRFN